MGQDLAWRWRCWDRTGRSGKFIHLGRNCPGNSKIQTIEGPLALQSVERPFFLARNGIAALESDERTGRRVRSGRGKMTHPQSFAALHNDERRWRGFGLRFRAG